MNNKTNHNPDVLDALANLSNDEVFSPPKIVNNILDILPEKLWTDKNITFLDPATKSGVFLREIAKRLIKGLEKEIPNLQKRLNHIYTKQIFGIGITELTSLLSRRSLYCSKLANGKYSTCTDFDNVNGNIRFERIEHNWDGKKCADCGANKDAYDRGESLETHAYEFIHKDSNKIINLFKEKNMKFDVIIGNPPYQLNVGNESGNSSKAKAIYHYFVEQAEKLNPRYLTMIIPSRWMTRSTEGISDKWIDNMLDNNKIKELHDFPNASDIFPGVEIKGGICYFLWKKNYNGKCNYVLHKDSNKENIISNFDYLNSYGADIVIRDIQALPILNKINKINEEYVKHGEQNFSSLVSPKDFFTNKQKLTSSWDGYSKNKNTTNCIKYYLNKNIHKLSFGWIKKSDIPKNIKTINLHKVYIPAAGGTGLDSQILGHPFYGAPTSVCSQTYLVIGYDPQKHNFSKKECENIISYIKTRFFRYLVSIKKKTQNGPRGVYQFVPMQDFSESWTDEKLYKKYKLTKKEIDFIEEMVREMK